MPSSDATPTPSTQNDTTLGCRTLLEAESKYTYELLMLGGFAAATAHNPRLTLASVSVIGVACAAYHAAHPTRQ